MPAVPEQPAAVSPAGCATLGAIPPQTLFPVERVLASVNEVQHVEDPCFSNKRVQIAISVLGHSADIPGSPLSSLQSQKPFSQLWQLHQLQQDWEPFCPSHSVLRMMCIIYQIFQSSCQGTCSVALRHIIDPQGL